MKDRLIARWQTRGKDGIDLYSTTSGYHYRGRNFAGWLPNYPSDLAAIKGAEDGPVAVLKSDRPSLRRVALEADRQAVASCSRAESWPTER